MQCYLEVGVVLLCQEASGLFLRDRRDLWKEDRQHKQMA